MMRPIFLATVVVMSGTVWVFANDDQASPPSEVVAPAPTVSDVRVRATMLHEMVRGTLQIMHRGLNYFNALYRSLARQ